MPEVNPILHLYCLRPKRSFSKRSLLVALPHETFLLNLPNFDTKAPNGPRKRSVKFAF